MGGRAHDIHENPEKIIANRKGEQKQNKRQS
jgi:hypothetical protein